MSEENLRTLLRDEVLADEPAFTLSSDAAKRQGRRSRTARRGLAAALVVAVVGAGTAGVMSVQNDSGSSLDAEIAEALANYDANAMPGNIRTAAHLAAEGTPAFTSEEIGAYDDQGNEIDKPDWDKASGWSGHFTWTPTHSLSISLSHSKSESEGNAQRYCDEGLDAGYYLDCDVSTTPEDALVISKITALKKMGDGMGWKAVFNPDRADPDKLWFVREVKAKRGGIFLGYAGEYVKAPDVAAATSQWLVSPERLVTLATEADLAFPEPPMGKNGCKWIVPEQADNISCGVNP